MRSFQVCKGVSVCEINCALIGFTQDWDFVFKASYALASSHSNLLDHGSLPCLSLALCRFCESTLERQSVIMYTCTFNKFQVQHCVGLCTLLFLCACVAKSYWIALRTRLKYMAVCCGETSTRPSQTWKCTIHHSLGAPKTYHRTKKWKT